MPIVEAGSDLWINVHKLWNGKDTEEIFQKILKRIRKIKGITRTETFVAVE